HAGRHLPRRGVVATRIESHWRHRYMQAVLSDLAPELPLHAKLLMQQLIVHIALHWYLSLLQVLSAKQFVEQLPPLQPTVAFEHVVPTLQLKTHSCAWLQSMLPEQVCATLQLNWQRSPAGQVRSPGLVTSMTQVSWSHVPPIAAHRGSQLAPSPLAELP